MKKSLFGTAFAVCLLLGGCAGAPPKTIEHYTLAGAGAAAGAAAVQAEQQSPEVLRVLPVTAPAWLQGTAICYRMAYHSDSQVASYADSRWSAPLPQMVEELTQNALSDRHAWKAVVGPGDNAKADTAVRIHVLNLCQDFQAPDRSAVVLDARVTLVNTGSSQVVAQREFRYRQAAPTPDAPGGVKAAREAAGRFAGDLTDWIAGLALQDKQ
ncbi:MAG: ABC-type transport auxiliary lipoprotein family protein [Gammaproteobacteria bacterium]